MVMRQKGSRSTCTLIWFMSRPNVEGRVVMLALSPPPLLPVCLTFPHLSSQHLSSPFSSPHLLHLLLYFSHSLCPNLNLTPSLTLPSLSLYHNLLVTPATMHFLSCIGRASSFLILAITPISSSHILSVSSYHTSRSLTFPCHSLLVTPVTTPATSKRLTICLAQPTGFCKVHSGLEEGSLYIWGECGYI